MKKQLQYICGFAGRKSPIAVRNAVQITNEFCYASDGTQSMKIAIDGPDLNVCVDAAMLHDILAGFPDDQAIKIEPGTGFVTIIGGRRKLKLRTLPAEAVAAIEPIEVKGDFRELDPAVVSQGLKFSSPAAATRDVARPFFNNTIIDFTNTGTFVVGCDGYRAHAFKIDDAVAETPITCALPAPLAKRLATLCEVGGKLLINRYRVIYSKGDAEFISILGDSQYADWRRVMPKPELYECNFAAGRKPMRAVVDSAARLGAKYIDMSVSDGVEFNADLGGDSFTDFLEADSIGKESITFNPRFMADALEAMGSDVVKLYVKGINSGKSLPMLITGDEPHVCFVMGSKS